MIGREALEGHLKGPGGSDPKPGMAPGSDRCFRAVAMWLMCVEEPLEGSSESE